MIGLLQSESSELKLFMGEQKLDKIWMPEAEGKLHPLALATNKERYLDNFGWFEYVRPVDKNDIFNWRPKKAGSELKKSVEHKKPKASLDNASKGKGSKKERKRMQSAADAPVNP